MLLLLACVGEIPEEETKSGKKPPGGDGDPTDGGDGDSAGTDDSGTETDPRAAVCARWEAAREDTREASWSGNVSSCDAGDLDDEGRGRALTVLNAYRFLAGQPEVEDDPAKNAASQECALMMHANGTLDHYPSSSWNCYSSSGASAAGSSNIASGPAVMAMDMYMQDWGNDTTIGHRRWILSNQLGPVGIGSTTSYSCLHVIYGSGSSSRSWVAWPPEGYFPYEALTAGGSSIDQNGWTVQSDSIDVSRADVSLSEDGVEKEVLTSSLLSGYGSTYAIKITPRGWQSRKGSVYRVTLGGLSQPIDYEVEMVDCAAY